MAHQPRLLTHFSCDHDGCRQSHSVEAGVTWAGGALGTAIELTDVSRSFRSGTDSVRAVDSVSLTVRFGEFACVLGASGSGKTTLLNLVGGLDDADQGEIVVAGHDLGGLSERERTRLRRDDVGVVFQDHNLIEEFTALENVALPLEAAGVDPREAADQAEAALDLVGLVSLAGRLPARLSGGQRQRVGIARALVGNRRILLADEPTGSLDSTNSRSLFGLLQHLCGRGVCVLLATHDPLSKEYVHTVYEMNDGALTKVR